MRPCPRSELSWPPVAKRPPRPKAKSPERACKPNPVPRLPGVAIIPLGPRSPSGSSSRPGGSSRRVRRDGRPLPPYLALLRMGFTVPPPLPAGRCALTAPFHPCRPFGRRFVFCGTFLRVTATGDYPACRPYGVRTFLPDFSGRSRGPLGAMPNLPRGHPEFDTAAPEVRHGWQGCVSSWSRPWRMRVALTPSPNLETSPHFRFSSSEKYRIHSSTSTLPVGWRLA